MATTRRELIAKLKPHLRMAIGRLKAERKTLRATLAAVEKNLRAPSLASPARDTLAKLRMRLDAFEGTTRPGKVVPSRKSTKGTTRSSAKPGFSLEKDADFASAVERVARGPGVKRFHGDRAFIASVYDVGSRKGGPFHGLTLQQFKERAVQAHRKSTLRLTRADLVGAMDSKLVERSETAYLSARFHFVALD